MHEADSVLFRHMARTQWGLAILAWDHGDKRGYQFEDGVLRVFKEGYFHFLEKVDAPPEGVLETLRRRLGWKETSTAKAQKKLSKSCSFDTQLALFKESYPKGFQGAKWGREKRGIDTPRRLQRHRDMAHLSARKTMCRAKLEKLLAGSDFAAVLETLHDVGNSTDLISKSTLRLLDELDQRELGERLFQLLHGEGEVAIRFERFADLLGRKTGKTPWQLATVFPALVSPKDHLCVKPRLLRAQAACLDKTLTVPVMPNAPAYERSVALAREVYQRLEEAGYHPRDLLDVYDFMEVTLSPKALKRLESMKTNASDPGSERTAA